MKRNFRSLISVLLVFAIVLGGSTITFAGEIEVVETQFGDLSIVPLDENSVLMTQGNTSAVFNIVETQNEIRFELTQENETNYFLYDKVTELLYSSYTGSTIALGDVIVEPEYSVMNLGGGEEVVAPLAEGDIVDTTYYYISYSEIGALLGDAYSTYDLAATIITVISIFTGTAAVTAVGVIYSFLQGALLSEILEGIENDLPGGVRVTVNLVEIRKHQGGKWVTGYAYQVASVSTY